MKKILIIITVILLFVTLGACSSNDEPTSEVPSDSGLNAGTTASTTENDKDVNNYDVSDLLSYTFKVPGRDIFIDVPNYQEIERGFTQLYILNGDRYVAITFAKNNNAETVSEAHEISFAIFKEAIQDYSYVNSMTIEKEAQENIGSIDLYKYIGKLNCGHDTVYDAYVVGYSFIMDNTPCTVTGSIINKDQSDDSIKEITALVEAMIKTLRSER